MCWDSRAPTRLEPLQESVMILRWGFGYRLVDEGIRPTHGPSMPTWISQRAVQAWQLATEDPELLAFAFVTRSMHLWKLAQGGQVGRHMIGGAFDPPWFPGRPLPSLSKQARLCIIDFLKVHCPVSYICSCKMKGFTAQMTLMPSGSRDGRWQTT